MSRGSTSPAICRYGNAAIMVVLAAYFFLIPGGIVVHDLRDPAWRDGGMPRCAFRWHRSLSPKYERWARKRVSTGAGAKVAVEDISGTEWPVFGSVFYLWATESLQEAWEKDNRVAPAAPKAYARGAIEAAASVVSDPGHAAWVQQHWGGDYLHRENVFYRMLLIAGLTSHYRLLGDATYLPLLRDQVETLSKALDESPWGLLDDYPNQCYPTDVLAAVACIRRADAVLGTDHSAFARRAIRAFQGELLDSTGLPPYAADSRTGETIGRSRGCGNSFMMIFVPELWEETGRQWYRDYEEHFWQHRWTAAGFREFPSDVRDGDWYMDVDAGPVLAGHGFAACAFGVGAARANGRFDHGYPLSAELLVTLWPLPHGTLAGPRILSNAVDAPYLGEAGVLFCLTRQPVGGVPRVQGGRLPGFVYILLVGYFGLGGLLVVLVIVGLRRWRRRMAGEAVPLATMQLGIWAGLVVVGCAVALTLKPAVGLVMLLGAQLLPKSGKTRHADDVVETTRPASS